MAIWILTRKQKPTDAEMADILTTVDAVLETNKLDHFEFRLTNPKCESVVRTNSEGDKLANEEPTTNLPLSPTNTPPKLQTNSGGYSGNGSTSSNTENNKSKPNMPSEVNNNKTRMPVQIPHDPGPIAESLFKQNSTNDSFTNNEVSRTCNSTLDKLSADNGKDKPDKNVLYSVLQNILNQNNVTNNKHNKDDKRSRRDRKGKLSKRKPGTFEPERNKLLLSPESSLAEKPLQDSYSTNGSSGDAHNLSSEQEEPEEGFLPLLARQGFFKYIPKAFNFDFWRI